MSLLHMLTFVLTIETVVSDNERDYALTCYFS